jgi:hypothetical protein
MLLWEDLAWELLCTSFGSREMICFTIILLVLRNPSLRKLKRMFVREFWLRAVFGVIGRIWNLLPGGILIASLCFELVL